MVQGIFQLFDKRGKDMVGSFNLHENFFNLNEYNNNGGSGMDRILSGLIKQVRPQLKKNLDQLELT